MEKNEIEKVITSELDRAIQLIGKAIYLRKKAQVYIPLQKYDTLGEINKELETVTLELRVSQQNVFAVKELASLETQFQPILERFDQQLKSFNSKDLTLPFSRSYWVVPGTILAGEIPSSTSSEERSKKMLGLLDAGVTAIINLTEDTELNHTGMPLIDYSEEINKMARERAINIEIHSMSIEDLNIPSTEFMKEILGLINDLISRNKTVYVHCWGGVGRTGTVVGCFLIDRGIVQPNEAIEMIELLKAETDIRHRDSPETDEQRKFLLNWKKDLSKMPEL